MARLSLSGRSVQVLSLLARGQTAEQILGGLACTYADIQKAAAEALIVCDDPQRRSFSLPIIQAEHPRAYEPWTAQEDARLR